MVYRFVRSLVWDGKYIQSLKYGALSEDQTLYQLSACSFLYGMLPAVILSPRG